MSQHANEIVITNETHDELMIEAMELGPNYVKALIEQINRQGFTPTEKENV